MTEQELLRDMALWNTPIYAEKFLQIVDKEAHLTPLMPKQAQLEFDAVLEAQRKAGKPERTIILKARKIGYSTWVQAKLIQRTTQLPYHHALVVAHDKTTAGKLFDIGELMHAHLPEDDGIVPKPRITNTRKSNYMSFGDIRSSVLVDTAKEVQSGRGQTFTELHCSEVAFWPDIETKLTGLLSTVPYSPGTSIVLESTANGYNHFRSLWVDAVEGRSDWAYYFSPWFDDMEYRKPFLSDDEKAAFIGSIGAPPYGEDEVKLIEDHDLDYEQLNWRRFMIRNEFAGDLRKFKQEYPATWEEAFISTGNTVFAPEVIQVVLDRTKRTDPDIPTRETPGPDKGALEPQGRRARQGKLGTIQIPEKPIWVSRRDIDHMAFWRVWQHPQKRTDEQPEGRYVISVDPATGEESDHGELAEHAIQVIDHRTRKQVAEYASRLDPDQAADEVYLAAKYYNDAWVVIERTGGYGLSFIRRIRWDYLYPFMYKRRPQDVDSKLEDDRLGWETTRPSKSLIEDGLKEMLREGSDGIRSRTLALQLTTYIKDQRGRTGPMKNHFSDRLMAYMIGQEIAQELPVRSDRKPGHTTSTRTKPVRFQKAQY